MAASLLPIMLRTCDPADLGSVDAAYFGMGSDGIEYVVKAMDKTPDVPAAEWICHYLAGMCGIPVPQFNILKLPDGTFAFGSQWDGSKVDQHIAQDILTGVVKSNLLSELLSRIYAFDLFTYNVDRHLGNYMFVHSKQSYSVRAFDFSRAFTVHGWPLPKLPLQAGCMTVSIFRAICATQPFNLDAANGLLDRVNEVPISELKGVIDKMPSSWMPKATRQKIVKWWSSNEKNNRINEVRKGLKNGSFL